MIPRVGLRCRQIQTLRSEAPGQAITMTFFASNFWTNRRLKTYKAEKGS